MRKRFSEIRQLPRGNLLDPAVNSIARDAVKKLGDADLLAQFNEAELGRWYGDLIYVDDSGRTVEFTFRHGVCQFFKVLKARTDRVFFRMNILNNSVDFRGGDRDEDHSSHGQR